MDVSHNVTLVSPVPEVRAKLVQLQQEAGKGGGVVMDGRDIGTVVFPKAEVKFYLDAAPETRARRRCDELRAKGQDAAYDAILEDIRARDHQDMNRDDSPLVRTDDAIHVDTSEMSPDEVIAHLLAEVEARIKVISRP